MALVAPAVLHIPVLLIAVRQRADAAAVGSIIARALVNKLHHKDATMCRRPAAEADFIGILLPVLAVRAVRLRLQAALHQLQLHPGQQVAAPVHQDITGCLIVAVGVCLTAQAVQAATQPPIILLRQRQLQLPPVNLLRLKQRLLHQRQPNLPLRQPHLLQRLVPLRLQQVNPHQPPALND